MVTYSPEMYRARREAEVQAGEAIGHTSKIVGTTMDDTCVCSCGWESHPYWDGAEYAQADWVKHIQEHGAEISYREAA